MIMNVTVDGTLFLFDPETFMVTICTWHGEEATLPVTHLCTFFAYLGSARVQLPTPLPLAGSPSNEESS